MSISMDMSQMIRSMTNLDTFANLMQTHTLESAHFDKPINMAHHNFIVRSALRPIPQQLSGNQFLKDRPTKRRH